jgi:hypothetical protein
MFTNYSRGEHPPFEKQAGDILDVVFRGIVSDAERRRLEGGSVASGYPTRAGAAGDVAPVE